ncbi:hypothetical protein EVAR_64636_1 [Eumeta japonica]|uniref:Uncharacterized protein n=1 Tax=Eumeta variegata TaxID=151549 RepID=A0A4C1Z7E2_EUMVA|nr:hypothetical protein EVAR_64636_1 [Eumeta japonica]
MCLTCAVSGTTVAAYNAPPTRCGPALGSQSLVCSVDVKAISAPDCASLKPVQYCRKRGKLFRAKKNIATERGERQRNAPTTSAEGEGGRARAGGGAARPPPFRRNRKSSRELARCTPAALPTRL